MAVEVQQLLMRCDANVALEVYGSSCLRECYAMSGTRLAHAAALTWVSAAMERQSDLWKGISPRACYAMPAYGAPPCYAMSSTEMAYGGRVNGRRSRWYAPVSPYSISVPDIA
eukprot:3020174-Rhodomonas_salina.1